MIDSGRTTELEVIRRNPNKYTWGKVLEIIDISYYTLVVYAERGMNTMEPTGNIRWSVYVNGKYTALGATSLEKAMILAVAQGNPDNKDPHMAAYYAGKVLGLESDEL